MRWYEIHILLGLWRTCAVLFEVKGYSIFIVILLMQFGSKDEGRWFFWDIWDLVNLVGNSPWWNEFRELMISKLDVPTVETDPTWKPMDSPNAMRRRSLCLVDDLPIQWPYPSWITRNYQRVFPPVFPLDYQKLPEITRTMNYYLHQFSVVCLNLVWPPAGLMQRLFFSRGFGPWSLPSFR